MTNEGENIIPALSIEERKKTYISSLEKFRKEARNRLAKQSPEELPLKEVIERREQAAPQTTTNVSAINIEPSKNGPSKELTTFRETIEEYKSSPHTPESEKKYWQARWEYYGTKAGLNIDVPPCDRTQEEINELTDKKRKLIYVPPQLSTIEGLTLLGKMHKKLGLYALEGKNIVNESDVSGWIDVEAALDIPNKGTTEPELRKKFEEEGKIGMNLPAYIIASEDSKDITRQRFDSKKTTWVRLPGSSEVNNRPFRTVRRVDACFNSEGFLFVKTISPEIKNPLLGGRSMGIKK